MKVSVVSQSTSSNRIDRYERAPAADQFRGLKSCHDVTMAQDLSCDADLGQT